MTKSEVSKLLESYKRTHYKSWKDMAKAIGVSSSFLSQVVNGKKEPCGLVLKFVGLEKTVSYTFIRPSA